jgi:hypothetical protein
MKEDSKMKKILFTTFLLAMAWILLSATGASALGYLVYDGQRVESKGTGFGDVTTLLTLQKTPSETGSVAWNGSADVELGDAKNTSQTWLFSSIIATGITQASQFAIVYNTNESGPDVTNFGDFTLQVFNPAGTVVFWTEGLTGVSGVDFPVVNNGVGGAGYLFTLDATAAAGLQPYFTTPDSYRLGATGTVLNTDDGPENFYFARVDALTPVPEPVTMLLFGLGLVGLAGVRRLKK